MKEFFKDEAKRLLSALVRFNLSTNNAQEWLNDAQTQQEVTRRRNICNQIYQLEQELKDELADE